MKQYPNFKVDFAKKKVVLRGRRYIFGLIA